MIILHLNKNNKMKSFFGGILSISYGAFILITIIYFTFDFFSNREKTVILGEKIISNL